MDYRVPSDLPTFRAFKLWSGMVTAGFDVNFLGQRTDLRFTADGAGAGPTDERRRSREARPSYPAFSEETFEWLAVLDAVLAAHRRFTMVELGAGFGRWLVAAAIAAKARDSKMELQLIGIEGDAAHHAWMLQHFRDNGLNPNEHRLIYGVVAREDSEQCFLIGPDPAAWYGQTIADYSNMDVPTLEREGKIRRVPGTSLETLLADVACVDIVDCDIQGAEGDVIAAGIETLTRKARSLFVETHSATIHAALRVLFVAHGWKPVYDYALGAEGIITPFGPLSLVEGGLQVWRNPHLL